MISFNPGVARGVPACGSRGAVTARVGRNLRAHIHEYHRPSLPSRLGLLPASLLLLIGQARIGLFRT